MHTLWLCLLPSVSVPLSTPSATMALKLPRKFNSQLEMYRARVGHTRIDDVEGNIGKRQGRRIRAPTATHFNQFARDNELYRFVLIIQTDQSSFLTSSFFLKINAQLSLL